MKLSFEKQALLSAISIVMKAVPSRTTMPILECILIDASDEEIKLTANDMELGIETKVKGNIWIPERSPLTRNCFPRSSENCRTARSGSNPMILST